MDPPDDAIETSASLFWLDRGIVYCQPKGAITTAGTVAEGVAACRELTSGTRRPILFNLRGWPGADALGLKALFEAIVPLFTAMAFIPDPESPDPDSPVHPAVIADSVDRLLVPARIFADEFEAVAFLQRHIDPQTSE